MSFVALGSNWLAHPIGFTVQVVDGGRVAYTDADGRWVLHTDVTDAVIPLGSADLTAQLDADDEAASPATVLARIAAGAVALGSAVRCSPDEVDVAELTVLLLDLEQLVPSALTELADQVADGDGTWDGAHVQIDLGNEAAPRMRSVIDAATGVPLTVPMKRVELAELVETAAGLTLGSHDGVLTVRTVGRDDRDVLARASGDHAGATAVTVTPRHGAPVRLVLADSAATLECVGRSSVLMVELEPESSLPFLLTAEHLEIDEEGDWSHRVEVRSDDEVHVAPDDLRTVGDLAIWVADRLVGAASAEG